MLSAASGLLHLVGMICRLGGHGMRYLCEGARHLYDIYIVIPLQIERLVGSGARGGAAVALRGQGARQ